MSDFKTVKTWTKTPVSNLVRHKSGRYYARLFRGDKETWKALKTTALEVAKNRLRDEQEAFGKQEVVAKPAKSGRMSMGEAIAKLEAQIIPQPSEYQCHFRAHWWRKSLANHGD